MPLLDDIRLLASGMITVNDIGHCPSSSFGASSRPRTTGSEYRLLSSGMVNYRGIINGRISLTKGWGKIVEHVDGYRVQKALVTDIYLPPFRRSGLDDDRLPEGWKKREVTVHRTIDSFIRVAEKYYKSTIEQKLVKIPSQESMNERRS